MTEVVIIFILHMRKLKDRKVKSLAQGHAEPAFKPRQSIPEADSNLQAVWPLLHLHASHYVAKALIFLRGSCGYQIVGQCTVTCLGGRSCLSHDPGDPWQSLCLPISVRDSSRDRAMAVLINV